MDLTKIHDCISEIVKYSDTLFVELKHQDLDEQIKHELLVECARIEARAYILIDKLLDLYNKNEI